MVFVWVTTMFLSISESIETVKCCKTIILKLASHSILTLLCKSIRNVAKAFTSDCSYRFTAKNWLKITEERDPRTAHAPSETGI